MSKDQFKKHLALCEGFWGNEEAAQEIIDSLSDADVNNLTSDEIYRLVDEFVEMGDNPEEADRDEIAQIIMDRMGVEDEKDFGDSLHDRENEDYEEYIEPSGVDAGWKFESVNLSDVVAVVLNEGSDLSARKQKKLDDLEDKLKAKGYKRSKDSAGGEYQYKWTKDGEDTYVVNYRFGPEGYAEYWKSVDEARRRPAAVPTIEPEDEFSAPEKVVDVGDDEDFEDYNRELDDLTDLGLDLPDEIGDEYKTREDEYSLGLRFD